MAFQEISTTGYGTRVGNSFKAIGGGFILFCLATALLWWNEGRAVKTEKMLDEAGNAYVEMENPDKRDASLNGQLICGTAMATTEDSLSDVQFGIGAKAISLRRTVEYYQWVEHSEESSEDKLGGKQETTTTYTYSREWTDRPVESAKFKDPAYQNKNFVLTTIDAAEQYAGNVSWGAYKLTESLIRSISSREALNLNISEALLTQFDQDAKTAYERFYGAEKQSAEQPAETVILSDSAKAVSDSINAMMANAENKKDLEYIHQAAGVLYFGRVPGSPEVGDVRVTFDIVTPALVTVMAVVDGDTFKPFKAKNGKRFQILEMGRMSGDEIIEEQKDVNTMLLWVLRIVGVLLVIIGLCNILGILETLLKVVPFVANIFGWGIGIISSILGIVWSLIIIALAWLFYRPLLGISLLAIAAFLIWFFAFKGKEKLKKIRN